MERQMHELQQGGAQWHQFRATHFGASEASAMLGLSPYKSRTELLREKKTGIAHDVDAATQRIFDRGHEIEALARPFAEAFISDDLYPVTCSYGNLSASCDGLTMDELTAWECKQFNAKDFELVKNGELPEKHWPQCQQVMYVTGAEKLLFTISDGTGENTAHVWVEPNEEQQQRIVNGWKQFNIDLATFVPEPEVIPAKAEPVMALPALSIQVSGAISIQSNLDRFGERLKSFIDETNATPETDQDFANLEQACKTLKDAEEALKQAEANALAQTASVDEMRRTVSYLADLARTNRLTFEKLVKSEKENRKAQIVAGARNELFELHQRIQGELPVAFTHPVVNFADAIKGKKTLSSMQDAVNTMLANAKIDAYALGRDLREKHTWYVENGAEHSFLFADLANIIYKAADDFQAVITNRIAAHKEQERLKAEAATKAQAEREERIKRETEERMQREAVQREEQIRGEAEAKARQEEQDRMAAERAEQDAKEKLVTQAVQEVEEHQSKLKAGSNDLDTVANDAEKTPGRRQLIMAVASKFFVSPEIAEQWLIEEFTQSVKDAA